MKKKFEEFLSQLKKLNDMAEEILVFMDEEKKVVYVSGKSGRPNKSGPLAMESLRRAIEKYGEGSRVHVDHWRKEVYLANMSKKPRHRKMIFKRNKEFFIKNGILEIFDGFVHLNETSTRKEAVRQRSRVSEG